MAEKLIPGIPEAVKIAILQQTDEDFEESKEEGKIAAHAGLLEKENVAQKGPKTVLQQVLESDVSRNDVLRKIDSGFNEYR